MQQSPKTAANVYTFGDSERAAERLYWLARTFEPSTLAFAQSAVARAPRRVADLGAGPGFLSAALHTALAPEETLGLECSPNFVAFGAPHLPPGVRLVLHDVTTPLGVDCDLLCARFLLTHLRNPGAALRTWYDGAAPHTLLCEELVDMTSELPELSRYYELVAHVQRAAGQDMNIGAKLDALVGTAGYALGPCGTTTLAFPVPTMARLHALNLPTLRLQPAVRERYTNDALDALQGRLEALRDGPHDGVVQVRMARVVAHRL